jgi:hypothetical protein
MASQNGAVMQKSSYKVGDRVFYAGFVGVVVGYDRELDMYEVRMARGSVVVPASDLESVSTEN